MLRGSHGRQGVDAVPGVVGEPEPRGRPVPEERGLRVGLVLARLEVGEAVHIERELQLLHSRRPSSVDDCVEECLQGIHQGLDGN